MKTTFSIAVLSSIVALVAAVPATTVTKVQATSAAMANPAAPTSSNASVGTCSFGQFFATIGDCQASCGQNSGDNNGASFGDGADGLGGDGADGLGGLGGTGVVPGAACNGHCVSSDNGFGDGYGDGSAHHKRDFPDTGNGQGFFCVADPNNASGFGDGGDNGDNGLGLLGGI